MAVKFNPFTGQLQIDEKGSGGGSAFFAGEVDTYADLPLDGTAALNSRWLVRNNSGTWPFSSYKQAGIYIRIATVGSSRDNDYKLTDTSFHDVMSDSAFLLFDNGDATRTAQFQLSGITAGQNRVLTWPNAAGTIARTEDFAAPPAIGNTTAAAASFTTLNATGTTELVNGTSAAGPFLLYNTSSSSNANYERLRLAWSSNTAIIGTDKAGTGSARALALQTDGTTRWTIVTGGDLESAANGVKARSCNLGVFGAGDFAISSNTAAIRLGVIDDTCLFREGSGVLGQRGGTTQQNFLLHGTHTSSTNYQRLAIRTKAVTLSALSGASVVTTGGFIPDGAVLVGLTTRVSTAITGATGYDIGDGTDTDRWGANIGVALATTSDNTNWTATTIQCFTAAQEVTLTAVGSNFTGGAVVIVAHYLAGEAD